MLVYNDSERVILILIDLIDKASSKVFIGNCNKIHSNLKNKDRHPSSFPKQLLILN